MSEFRTYLFRYRFDSADWGFQIKAASEAEAKERLKSLAWATYDGELVATISDLGPGTGLILGCIARIRNWFSRIHTPTPM